MKTAKRRSSKTDANKDLSSPQPYWLRHTLPTQSDWVLRFAWSPDGKYLATGSHEKVVRIWDAESWECRSTLVGHQDFVHSIAWSPDGKILATASSDKTVRQWDPISGTPI